MRKHLEQRMKELEGVVKAHAEVCVCTTVGTVLISLVFHSYGFSNAYLHRTYISYDDILCE